MLPHVLIKYMHICIKLEICVVKGMSTLKNCCQFKALKNDDLEFFSTPLILSVSFIKKLSKKEPFLTSQRNNSFTDVVSSWHGMDMQMEFTYCLPVTHTVNNSWSSILVAYFDSSGSYSRYEARLQPTVQLTPFNHRVFRYKRNICQGSNYTIYSNLISS